MSVLARFTAVYDDDIGVIFKQDEAGPLVKFEDHKAAIATLTAERDKLAEALKAITTLGGNQSGDALTTKTGPNDAVARGIMYVTARDIARTALASLNSGERP